MKKGIKKLALGKRTISNLSSPEMARQLGGGQTNKGNTCGQHQTCTCSCINCGTGYCTYGCSQSTCGSGQHGCVCTTA